MFWLDLLFNLLYIHFLLHIISYVKTHYSSHLLYYVLLPLASTDYQDSSFLK